MSIVLIPSAKLVSSELQNLGKLPAIIYPVNKKIVLDYLIEKYDSQDTRYEIVCYEAADTIRRCVSSYKKTIGITELDSLKDLGYSIYCGIKKCLANGNTSIIINFADTIVYDDLPDGIDDCIFYAEDQISDTWTFFEEEDGNITNIIDKQKKNVSGMHSLFVGIFKLSSPSDFIRCYEEELQYNRKMDSFYVALTAYSKIHQFSFVHVKNWFDIGHADKYFNTQLEVKAREFNHITIDKERGILKKTSDDKVKFHGEILWYIKLPVDVEYVRPRVFDYSLNYNDMYVSMEYYAYHTLHELFLYGDLDKIKWTAIFSHIKYIIKDFSRYTVVDINIIKSLEEMYLHKTIERLNKLKDDKRFTSFWANPIVVNNKKFKPLEDIVTILLSAIPEKLYNINSFQIIHGDLCFANIMVDNYYNFIKVIDPRGKFGSFDIYGDRRYELAKLFHSLDGKYDFIIKDLFSLEVAENQINFSILERQRDFDIFDCFINCFGQEIGNEKQNIEFIESLLFLSMVPLHKESSDHQYVMLATGLEILSRCIDIYED